jgi:hypothetical protein
MHIHVRHTAQNITFTQTPAITELINVITLEQSESMWLSQDLIMWNGLGYLLYADLRRHLARQKRSFYCYF